MSSIRNSIAALATAAASTHIKQMVPLSFAGHEFQIAAPAALFWPEQKALLVADLHSSMKHQSDKKEQNYLLNLVCKLEKFTRVCQKLCLDF